MPHIRTITETVFSFDELSDSAKETARRWYREASEPDEWWDASYEDAVQCGAILGITINPRNQKCILTGPKTREWIATSPAIYFSGFWSQGDGACFEGSYSFQADAAKVIRDHAPKDEKLHAIADSLTEVPYPAGWFATMKQNGHYCHSGCMAVDVQFDDEIYRAATGQADAELPQAEFSAGEETITLAMRAFADWIYRQLEAEYDYLNSDETVDDNIRANEYEFTESGERAA